MFKLINTKTFYLILKSMKAAPGYYGTHKRRYITMKYKGEILDIVKARQMYLDVVIDELKQYVGSKVKYLGTGKMFNTGDPHAHYFFYDLTSISCGRPVYALLILYKGIENDIGRNMVVLYDENENYTFSQTNNFIMAQLTTESDLAFIGAMLDGINKHYDYVSRYLTNEFGGDANNILYVNFSGEGSDFIERKD